MAISDIQFTAGTSRIIQAALLYGRSLLGAAYSQTVRDGPTYDCSSFCFNVWQATFDGFKEQLNSIGLTQGPMEISRNKHGGAHYTGNLAVCFTDPECGFTAYAHNGVTLNIQNTSSPKGIQSGDILVSNYQDVEQGVWAHAIMIYGYDPVEKVWYNLESNGNNGVCICKFYALGYDTCVRFLHDTDGPTITFQNAKRIVERLYNILFGRMADEGGLNNWAGTLVSNNQQIRSVYSLIVDLMSSAEYKSKNYSKNKVIKDIYNSMRVSSLSESEMTEKEPVISSNHNINVNGQNITVDGISYLLRDIALNIQSGNIPDGNKIYYNLKTVFPEDINNVQLASKDLSYNFIQVSSNLYVKKNGAWIQVTPFGKINGHWKQAEKILGCIKNNDGSTTKWVGD